MHSGPSVGLYSIIGVLRIIAVVLLLAVAITPRAAAVEEPALRVLFVGNSYTRFNNLPLMFRRLAESHGDRTRAEGIHQGGFQLRTHWIAGTARTRIRAGHYTHVVLQEHSLTPIAHPERLDQYAGRFKAEIDRAGARTVLYETWARRSGHRLYRTGSVGSTPDEMLDRIASVLGAFATSSGADIAPVGHAWARVVREHPEIELYRRDGTHPTQDGTYLAACVIYRVVSGQSPVGLTYRPWPMTDETAAVLQGAADTR